MQLRQASTPRSFFFRTCTAALARCAHHTRQTFDPTTAHAANKPRNIHNNASICNNTIIPIVTPQSAPSVSRGRWSFGYSHISKQSQGFSALSESSSKVSLSQILPRNRDGKMSLQKRRKNQGWITCNFNHQYWGIQNSSFVMSNSGPLTSTRWELRVAKHSPPKALINKDPPICARSTLFREISSGLQLSGDDSPQNLVRTLSHTAALPQILRRLRSLVETSTILLVSINSLSFCASFAENPSFFSFSQPLFLFWSSELCSAEDRKPKILLDHTKFTLKTSLQLLNGCKSLFQWYLGLPHFRMKISY